VNAQLLDVKTAKYFGASRVDASADDIIAVQDEITKRIVDGLRLELSPDEQAGLANRNGQCRSLRRIPARPRSLCAFYLSHGSGDDCNAAIERFNRAIALDAISAWPMTAWARVMSIGSSKDRRRRRLERAEAAFRKALESTAPSWSPHADGFCYLWRGQKQKARDEVARMRREAPTRQWSIL